MEYAEFLARKAPAVSASGFDADIQAGTVLFPFQADIVRWALRMGKAAVFTATGSGKTRIQATWADQVAMHTDGDVLIVAPLAVAAQTVAEAARIGIHIRYCRAQADVQPGVTITNYDMLHAFDPSRFVGVVLEESSILKSHDSRTRRIVTEGFAGTPYRLCCTATPAPNDYMELGNHAEFLGVMTQAEMLSMYFIHDGGSTQDWRLKGHAVGDFWRWVASWSVLARTPADLGYSADGYILPPLRTHVVTVDGGDDWARERGYLFAPDALSLNDARSARRESMAGRVQACADLVNGTPGQWLVWCALNAEGDELARRIHGAVQVAGADSREHKERSLLGFAAQDFRVLVSKSSIAGFGMNWQQCHQMAFVGVDYSYEGYYQAVRRCWRFGQTSPVDVHLFLSDAERGVLASLNEKAAAAERMADEIVRHVGDTMRHNLGMKAKAGSAGYNPQTPMRLPDWLLEEAS